MKLNEKVEQVRTLLSEINTKFKPAVFANSLGAEDMVLTHLLAETAPEIEHFMLDTGRLHEETYALLQRVRDTYPVTVRTYFPSNTDIEAFVATQGPNPMYESVELRKRCCTLRKVKPLQRALLDKKAWITGLRREQSSTRTQLNVSEWDSANGLQKFNPLLDWSDDDVWAFIRQHDVPYNALHDRNFPSIGCAPCTRAIAPGEDVRAGRWWWETADQKECGLHNGEHGAAPIIGPIRRAGR